MSELASLALAFAVTATVLIGAGALMLWLARAGERGTLRRNQFAGVRTATTLASDGAWHSAHRAAAPRTRVAGWGAIAGGLAVLALTLVPAPFEVRMTAYCILTFGSAAWLLGWVLAAGSTAHYAARATTD